MPLKQVVFPKFVAPLIFALALLASTTISSSDVFAEEYFVSPGGDNSNDGSCDSPWQTISFACLQLSPGDILTIGRGTYGNNGSEGNILLRYQDPVSGEYHPLEGSRRKVTRIRAEDNCRPPLIYGSLDIRGSYISVRGLEFASDRSSNGPGIVAYESHNVGIYNNIVHDHGGGGINFNQCDLVRAERNTCYNNANKNPDQHSGISSYQAMVRTKVRGNRYGVIIRNNICFCNRNLVPTAAGRITDGNGVAIDDHMYRQTNDIILAAMQRELHSESSSGKPSIGVNADGSPKPYVRPSLVEKNLCFYNGGRGVSVYLAENVTVRRNTLVFNLQSPEFVSQLPRDPETGLPYFYHGELGVIDSNQVNVRWNLALAAGDEVAAAEHYFEIHPPRRRSTNKFRRNLFVNLVNFMRSVNVFGVDRSQLLRFGGF